MSGTSSTEIIKDLPYLQILSGQKMSSLGISMGILNCQTITSLAFLRYLI
ncbi:unnamed protein product, partial [Gulo gulo]